MHIISKKALTTFYADHPSSAAALEAWYKVVSKNNFENFAAIKQSFNTADKAGEFVIFDIGGNKFRLICVFHFDRKVVYVREVFTHLQYDKWNKNRKGS